MFYYTILQVTVEVHWGSQLTLTSSDFPTLSFTAGVKNIDCDVSRKKHKRPKKYDVSAWSNLLSILLTVSERKIFILLTGFKQ